MTIPPKIPVQILSVAFVAVLGAAVVSHVRWTHESEEWKRQRLHMQGEIRGGQQKLTNIVNERNDLQNAVGEQRIRNNDIRGELDRSLGEGRRHAAEAESYREEKERVASSLELLRLNSAREREGLARRSGERVAELETKLAVLEEERHRWQRQMIEIETRHTQEDIEDIGDRKLVDELELSVRDVLSAIEDVEDGASAISRLGRMELLLPVIERFVHDPKVSKVALDALAHNRGCSEERFMELVSGGLPPVEGYMPAAGRSLVHFFSSRGQKVHEALDRLAKHDSPRVRLVTVHGMAAIRFPTGDWEAADRIQGFLDDPDSRVRDGALTLLTSPGLIRHSAGIFVARAFNADDPHRALYVERLVRSDVVGALQVLCERALTDHSLESAILDVVEENSEIDHQFVVEVLPFLREDAGENGKRWIRLVMGVLPSGGEPKSAAHLRQQLVNDARLIRPMLRCVTGAMTVDPPEVKQALKKGFSHESPDRVCRFIVNDLSKIGPSVRLLERSLARACLDGHDQVIAVAARELVRMPAHRHVGLLLGFLEQVDDDLRLELAAALASVGHDRGLRLLESAILEDRPRRRRAIELLIGIGGEAPIISAQRAFDSGDKDAVWRLIELLFPLKIALESRRVEELLTNPLMDPNRADVIYPYLEETAGPGFRGLVAELLLSGRVEESAPAISFLSTPTDPKLEPIFRSFLDDAEPSTRAAALSAMGLLAPKKMTPAFTELARDASPIVRVHLARVLKTVNDQIARGMLVVLSKDEDWMVREAAVQAMQGHRGPTVVPALKARIRDDHREVRNSAGIALLCLGRYDDLLELFADVEDPILGPRTRRFLGTAFGRNFDTAGAWAEWWDSEGRYHHERNGGDGNCP